MNMRKEQVIDISRAQDDFYVLLQAISAAWIFSERNALIKWYPYNNNLSKSYQDKIVKFNDYLTSQGMVIENELLPKESFYVYIGCLREDVGYRR